MKNDFRSRKWQITINNPIDKGFTSEVIENIIKEFSSVIYWCMSDEIGKSGTYHTHIYLVANNAIRFSTMKKRFDKAHFEVAKGSSIENRDYIFKQGKWAKDRKNETNLSDTHKEFGEIPIERQGARNDLTDLYDMIKQGMDNYEILENTPEHIMKIDKIEKARQIVKENEYRKIFRKLSVTYLYGKTALGKTRFVMDKHGYENVYRVTDYKNSFDGYNSQEIICFEEFRSNIDIASMLNYLDGYPLELPCRYANKIACFNTVYIISNIPLDKQYLFIQHNEPETWQAFLRRINNILEFNSNGTVTKNKEKECLR